jgi:alpha/beta superfamily hydrolase
MAEERIFIDSEGLKIEALLENLPGDKGVVVTHPHPLYGGEMHNNVVEAVVQAYRGKGYSTLRFNFRGVGASQGEYDNGRGEQEDVAAALNLLHALGKGSIDLAGYSFGAWVSAQGLERFHLAQRLIMVSPPANYMDFSFLRYSAKIRLVIVGTRDEIAGCRGVEEMLSVWNPEAVLKIIEGADHFYWGKTTELETIITGFLDQNE